MAPAVFKTDEAEDLGLAGSIPVRLRQARSQTDGWRGRCIVQHSGLVTTRREHDPGREPPDEQAQDLAELQLDVYESRSAWWNPEYGELLPPDGWAFLPSGDAFVTRTVKAAGVFWLAWAPRTRSRRHRRLLGLWAPRETVEAAQQAAADTEVKRAARREAGARSRERKEAAYQHELAGAIAAYLAFAPEHQVLADGIAQRAAARAAAVGSGRVGRTRVLSLKERAALAARAEIRHSHTDYHQRLNGLGVLGAADELYGMIKADAQDAVDAFLQDHRSGPS